MWKFKNTVWYDKEYCKIKSAMEVGHKRFCKMTQVELRLFYTILSQKIKNSWAALSRNLYKNVKGVLRRASTSVEGHVTLSALRQR